MGKMRSGKEDAISAVLTAGKQFGHGNMIYHLKIEWAARLVIDYDMPVDVAVVAADVGQISENMVLRRVDEITSDRRML